MPIVSVESHFWIKGEGRLFRNCVLVSTLLACLTTSAKSGTPTNLNCKTGPVEKIYGGTKWLVYGCDDKQSVLVVTAPGNPAMPFMFVLHATGDSYNLHGEGTGDKKLTDAAVKVLSQLSKEDIASLYSEAEHKK